MKKNKLNNNHIIIIVISITIILLLAVYLYISSSSQVKPELIKQEESIIQEELPDSIETQVDEKEYDIYTQDEFLSFCSDLNTSQDLIDYIDTINISTESKQEIINSIGGPKDITENILLSQISEIDEEESINIRLDLYTIFFKLNETESSNTLDCEEIYSQYKI